MLKAKIVLTGGPCAGKTTALSKIEEHLEEYGYKVMVVSESATELIKGGIRPFGEHKLDLDYFQTLMVKYQLDKEKVYEMAANSLSDDVVIIYDRGVIDNKAYINQSKFDEILSSYGLKELSLMDNYDMVLHLVTAADGAENFYTLGNNSARTETVDEAKALDSKTVNAWLGHSNLKIIDNSTNFEDKLKRVLDSINNLLGLPKTSKKQIKFLVDLDRSDLSKLDSEKIHIEQYYLDTDNEVRLRKRTLKGDSTYYYTEQIKGMDGVSTVLIDKKITEKDFHKKLLTSNGFSRIEKDRYSFVYNKKYYRLDIMDGYGLLEVDGEEKIELPDFLHILDEVTNNPNYQNKNLAKSKKEKVKVLEKK